MSEKPPSIMDLLKEALEEESAGLHLPRDKALALAAQLRKALPQLAEPVTAEDRAWLALGEERAERWHRSVLGAVKVVARRAGEQARLILGQVSEAVAGAPSAWQFSHTMALRGGTEQANPARATSLSVSGQPDATLDLDETSAKPRLVCTIRGLAEDQKPPLLLLTPLDAAKDAIIVRPQPSASGTAWRYVAEFEPGEYEAVFGPE